MKAAFLSILLLGVVLAGAYFMRPSPLRLTDAAAEVISPDGRQLAVQFKVQNDGPAVWLAGVSTPEGTARIYAPESDGRLPLPSEAAATFALDGAHVTLDLPQAAIVGQVLPLRLTFSNGDELGFRARVVGDMDRDQNQAGEVGLFGFGDICIAGDGEPAPEVSLSVRAESNGWVVDVLSSQFRFAPELVDGPHIPGTGHGHLYLGGVKLSRLYAPQFRIGELPPGEHVVRVTLNTNDHRAYVVDDQPVTALAKIVVR